MEPAQVARALRQADEAIAQLLAEVALLPEGERGLVTLLITTDHGRGPGPLWADHGAYPSSRDIFLLALGALVPGGASGFTQADLPPTVGALLGLCPSPCAAEGCGRTLQVVAGARECAE